MDPSAIITTIDQKIAELFNSNFNMGGDWPWGNVLLCAIAIILCVLLCGIVGFEREKRGRSAGLRTHLLVGLGSCLVMIVSIYGFSASSINVGTRDVARLAAGVVAGVGFLGAGVIIHNNGSIKGLTTASTIWLVMAIGLCCGSMNFILAIGGTLVVMLVLISFRGIERNISKTSPYLTILCPLNTPVMSIVLDIANEHGCTVNDVNSQIIKDGSEPRIEMTFKLSTEDKKIKLDLLNIVKELEERTKALSVQVLNHH